jgi:hypothetical protein
VGILTLSFVWSSGYFVLYIELIDYVIISFIHIPVAPLEHRASVKRFVSLKFLNLVDSRYDSLDGGSARRRAATCTGQHKLRINVEKHPCLE